MSPSFCVFAQCSVSGGVYLSLTTLDWMRLMMKMEMCVCTARHQMLYAISCFSLQLGEEAINMHSTCSCWHSSFIEFTF